MKTLLTSSLSIARRAGLRGAGLAASVGFVALLTAMTSLIARYVREYRAEHDPLEQSRRIASLLGRLFSNDIASRLERLPVVVLVASLTLLAILPLLGAVLAAAPESERRGAVARTIGATLALAAATVLAICVAAGITLIQVPGALSAKHIGQLAGMAGLAVVAALPSTAFAALVRDAVPFKSVGVFAAVGAAVLLRYALPWAGNNGPLETWLVPRSYELGLLSSSSSQVLTSAVLCVAWSVAALGAYEAIVRHAARARQRVVSGAPTASRSEV